MSRVCSKSTAKITYLHNALGQRVFKSEPQVAQTAPSEEELGPDFVAWLKKNYAWMFDKAQSNATVGQSYVYGDGNLPEYALLAEYGNGSSSASGRLEYIWLPTDSGAIPIGLFKSNRLYSIHTDHLNTPRLVKDDDSKPVWQWPYSAFGDNKPTGILKATTTPNNAITQDATTNVQLKATTPTLKLNLRYPGQYFDEESNLNYNYNRSYVFGQGRYSQADPIGLDGGWNRFGYGEQNPLSFTDPEGEKVSPGDNSIYPPTTNCTCVATCMAEPTPPFTVVGAMCSKISGKTPGSKALKFTLGKAVSKVCGEVDKYLGCTSACADFCSGKQCENPYPAK